MRLFLFIKSLNNESMLTLIVFVQYHFKLFEITTASDKIPALFRSFSNDPIYLVRSVVNRV